MRKYIKLLGLVLLATILIQADLAALWQSVKQADPAYIAIALLLGIGSVVVKSFRWWFMLRCDKQNYSFASSVRSYFSGAFAGLITPGRLGEFSRVYYVKRDLAYPTGRAAATVVLDRLLDLYFLIVVGVLALFHFGLASNMTTSMILVTLFLLLAPIFLVLPRAGNWLSQKLFSVLSRNKIGKFLRSESNSFYDTMKVLMSWKLIVGVVATILSYAMVFLGGYLITVGLGIEISPIDAALLLGLSSFISLIPISILGIGTRDGVFVMGFMSLGLPESQALAYSVMVLLSFFLGTALVGLYFFMRDRPPSTTESP